MINGKLRGHNIIYVAEKWLYKDTMMPTIGHRRSCNYCKKQDTSEGHDSCLGIIPGAINACCGHGENNEAYIQYCDGSIVRGKVAFNKIKKRNKLN